MTRCFSSSDADQTHHSNAHLSLRCSPCLACLRRRRAGELSAEELESVMTIVANPRAYKIPDWFLNRQKDIKDGRYSQVRTAQPGRQAGWQAEQQQDRQHRE